jgi:uncharacterized protein YdgA (DUF945 family)
MNEKNDEANKIYVDGSKYIAHALDLIGNQKIKILSYILANANKDNLFIGTMRTIAERTDTSTNTVNVTIRTLMDADIEETTSRSIFYKSRCHF